MNLPKDRKFKLAAAVVIVLGIILLIIGYVATRPLPDLTDFKSRYFAFTYPREFDIKEYSPGEVSVGHTNGQALMPLVLVNRYQSDPDVAAPESFDAFMKRQASALCGNDDSVESVTCTEVAVTPYESPLGSTGQKLDLTLVRKNLTSGTTTSETYGPIYVFNTTATSTASTSAATTTPEEPLRYSAVFIYPALSAFLISSTSPELLNQVVTTFSLR